MIAVRPPTAFKDKTMAQSFPEKAHLKTDPEKFSEGWDRIFGKKETETLYTFLPRSKPEDEKENDGEYTPSDFIPRLDP